MSATADQTAPEQQQATPLQRLLRVVHLPEILRPVLAGEGLAAPATLEVMLLSEPSEYVAAAVLAVSTRGE